MVTDHPIRLYAAIEVVRHATKYTDCDGEHIIKALSALPSVNEWLDIDSAKSHTDYNVWWTCQNSGSKVVGLASKGDDGRWWSADKGVVQPQGCIPLPAPPNIE